MSTAEDLTLMNDALREPTASALPAAGGRRASRGVYFLANDAIFDIAVAFLNSFRLSNPAIPLCLIPYGPDVDRLSALAATYNFTVFEGARALNRCDAIALKFFNWPCGQFRKLCAFDGPFDEFIYVDCDTVVLRDLTFAFQYLARFDIVFSHSGEPGLRPWVWKDTIYASGLLSAPQIAFSANTGFFCSRKGVLSFERAQASLGQAQALAPHMELACAEQPFLNFLTVTSGLRYTSLYEMSRRARALDIPLEKWAGASLFRKDAVKHRREDIFLVHWAGVWSASPSDRKLYAILAKLGLRSRTPSVKFFMPRKGLWKRYRHVSAEHIAEALKALERA